ncbi:MAG: peptidylprolyl isomerase, partial [Gemmataceae bacterium]|nr:peptidylprolyl isomerase [Gemmataceae bacterium]
MLLGRLFAVLSIISLGLIGCVSTPVKETAKNYPPATVSNAARAQSPENDLSASADEIKVAAAESLPKPGQKNTGSNIVALVNGEAVLEEEVLLTLSQGIGEGANDSAKRKAAINQLVEREIVIQDAYTRLSKNPQAKKFLDKLQEMAGKEFDRYVRLLKERNKSLSDPEFKALLESQGISLDLLRRQSERNFIAMQYMQTRIIPNLDRIGHKQIRDYYDTHPEEFQIQDSVEWKDIFISYRNSKSQEEAMETARKIVEKAKKGEDFAKLSKEYCHGDGAFRNAEGIGRKKGEIKPVQVEKYLFELKDGEVGPLVELPTGIHIIMLVKRELAGIKVFDEKVQKQVRDRLRNEAGQYEMKRMLSDMKRQAVIEYI